MKTKSKALLLALCAVLLIAASVLGTMAYLTSQDQVTNTFSVGSVSITLDEQDVKPDGTTDTENVDNDTLNALNRVQANEYHLLPGHKYIKDPIIHVDPTSENCYLFVKVVDEIADIEDAETVATQMANNGWAAVDGVANTYVYIGTDEGASVPLAVSGGSNITVFETFKIKGSVTNTELAKYKDKTITVTAYAVQMDGFEGKKAAEIWSTTFGTSALPQN